MGQKSSSKFKTRDDLVSGDRIMIVDDNPFNLMGLKHMLETNGFDVTSAVSG